MLKPLLFTKLKDLGVWICSEVECFLNHNKKEASVSLINV